MAGTEFNRRPMALAKTTRTSQRRTIEGLHWLAIN
jgi:hypothetical protein